MLSTREGIFQDETNPALTLINMAKESAKYKTRMEEINEFNEVGNILRRYFDLDFQDASSLCQRNLWKKRGLSMIPALYHHNYWGTQYHIHLSVYRGDGTVAVSHGGIEMGQGINTKVAQVGSIMI